MCRLKNYMSFFFLLFFVSLFSSVGAVDVVFRYDDFMLKNDSVNEEVVRIFQKHKIPLVLGVIPYDSSEHFVLEKNYPFMSTLKHGLANGSIELALHGYNHIKVADNGEFENVPFEEQYRRIKTGKQFLDSVFQQNTATFIPPWNAYDENTLKVMEKLGMKVISSSLTINQPYSSKIVNYFPHTLGEPQKLISIIEDHKKSKGIIILMFHSYDMDNNFSLKRLDSLLSKVEEYRTVDFFTFSELIKANQNSDGLRFSSNLNPNLLYKWLKSKSVLEDTISVVTIRVVNLIVYLLSCTFIFLSLLFFIAKKNFIPGRKVGALWCSMLLVIGIFVWFHILSPTKLLVIALAFSPILGIILGVIYKNNHNHNHNDKVNHPHH